MGRACSLNGAFRNTLSQFAGRLTEDLLYFFTTSIKKLLGDLTLIKIILDITLKKKIQNNYTYDI